MKATCLPFRFTNSNFSLEIKRVKAPMRIVLKMLTSVTNTSSLPCVSTTLEKILPSIYESTCYNYANLSFAKEVVQTETGHLFEHILLAYLCHEKLALGFEDAAYEGVTMWDWGKDSYGTFYIDINIEKEETPLLLIALQKSVQLFDTILNDPLTPRMGQTSILPHSLKHV